MTLLHSPTTRLLLPIVAPILTLTAFVLIACAPQESPQGEESSSSSFGSGTEVVTATPTPSTNPAATADVQATPEAITTTIVAEQLASATPAPAPTAGPTATPTPVPTAEPPPTPEATETPTPTPPNSGGEEEPAAPDVAQDIEGPELVEVLLSVGSVDVSDGPASIVLTTRVTDDASGINRIQFDFYSPSGRQEVTLFERWQPENGSARDGEHIGTMTVPHLSEAGEWRLTNVYLHDNAGNLRSYDQDELMGLGFDLRFEVVSTMEDVEGPELVEVSLSVASVDVSDGPASIVVTAHVTDDASGINRVQFDFYSPSGRQEVTLFERWQPENGSARDGEHVGTMTIPRFSEMGEWALKDVFLHDNAGNLRSYNQDDLTHLGFDIRFEVVSAMEDVEGPELVEVSLSVASVDVSDGPASIVLTTRVTDDASGINRIQFDFHSPSGRQEVTLFERWQPKNGSARDGEHVGTMTIPRFSETGEWRLTNVYLHDNAGNLRSYDQDELTSLGLNLSFHVQ